MPPSAGMCAGRIAVTGSTGLIGSYAVRELIAKGFDVAAVSRSGRGPAGISLNLHDTKAVREFMSAYRPEYLLHLAWNIEPGYEFSPQNLEWVASSLNLLQIFAENGGRRAVFSGSCFEYDMNFGFLSEDVTPLNSSHLYGNAKSSLCRLSSLWAEQIELSFAWGRVFFLYGKNERPGRIVPYIISSLMKGVRPIIKYPYIMRDYLYAGDAAGGLIALMLSDYRGVVNICSGKVTALRDIAEKAAVLMHCPVPEYEEVFDENMPPFVVGDCRKLNQIIGFRPCYSWERGLSEVIEEMKSHEEDQRSYSVL